MSKFVHMNIFLVEYGFDPSERDEDWDVSSYSFPAKNAEDALRQFRKVHPKNDPKKYSVFHVQETEESCYVYVE